MKEKKMETYFNGPKIERWPGGSSMKTVLRFVFSVIAILVLLGCSQSLRADTVFNVVTQFSISSNPNGVWSYDHNGIAYTGAQGFANLLPGVPAWWTNAAIPNSLVIGQNVTGSTLTSSTISVPNNTLWMDPESGNVSIIFTAPSAGTYTISGDFLGADTTGNSHPVNILDNGLSVFSGTISTFGADDSFGFSENLSTGDTISFVVGTGSPSSSCSYCFLSTGLRGTITLSTTPTPEPGTLMLLGAGLLGLAGISRRRRFVQS
jgi:hypothetical protein